ncbi:MAG: hypothetical protein AAF664_20265, partial [Planctomycetota bacterium]
AIQGGGPVEIGEPPSDTKRDWLAVIRPGDPKKSYASVMSPSADATSVGKKSSSKGSMTLLAIEDFDLLADGDFIPAYFDKTRKALAINAAKYQDKFAAAISSYEGPKGKFDLVLTTLTETDGESSYRVFVGGKKVGEVTNPETTTDYKKVNHRFKAVQLSPGDLIRVEFSSASNGKIPEGDAFAYSRGRWTSLAILKPNAKADQASKPAKKMSDQAPPFLFNYDPTKAKKVSVQTNGIVVVEAEDFDKVDREKHRKWYLTTLDKTPEVTPDPDPNHAEGASGGAYIELLPDTRVTHADPLSAVSVLPTTRVNAACCTTPSRLRNPVGTTFGSGCAAPDQKTTDCTWAWMASGPPPVRDCNSQESMASGSGIRGNELQRFTPVSWVRFGWISKSPACTRLCFRCVRTVSSLTSSC